ncbi:MAG: formate dehydrogenase accessory sulfurtransferase FdhD [Nocardioides sp.]
MADPGRRPGPTVRVRVDELTATGDRSREDRLATEEPLEIRLAWPGQPPHRVWVTMRTPGHDFELAAGYLMHEGVLDPARLSGVAYCTEVDLEPAEEFNVVTVTLTDPPLIRPPERLPGSSAGSAACGVCGKDSIGQVLDSFRAFGSPIRGGQAGTETHGRPSPAVIRALPERLRAGQSVFAKTGGVHAAGLADPSGRLLIVREDVGRHNAVDKVAGARVLAGESPASAVLVLSGRVGFELVQKAAMAGVGTVVAVGAPSSLAVALARRAGLGLYGFTSPDRCVRYV